MKFPSRTPTTAPQQPPGTQGLLYADRRLGSLLPRLGAGSIAVIDQIDLDRTAAEALRERRVAAVVNASAFISGRYPNRGPRLLAEAGIVLVDNAGSGVLQAVRDGQRGRLHDGTLYVDERPVASGRVLTTTDIDVLLEDARGGLGTQLSTFTHNTTEYLRREQGLLLHGEGAPKLTTPLAGRPVVVVVQGYDYREDLKALKRYIRDQKPVLVGVGSGAEALLEAGYVPDLLVAGQESFPVPGAADGRALSEKALRRSGEVVLHADESDRLLGAERVDKLGVRPRRIASGGTSEDVALLLADLGGASVIITVGTHATLDEFLDRQRTGLASTFLTRLRVGPKLVDAKSIPQVYAGRVRLWHLLLVLLVGLLAVAAAIGTTPIGQEWWLELRNVLSDSALHLARTAEVES